MSYKGRNETNDKLGDSVRTIIYAELCRRWIAIRGYKCGSCGKSTTEQLRWSDRKFVAMCPGCYKTTHPNAGKGRRNVQQASALQGALPEDSSYCLGNQPIGNPLPIGEPVADPNLCPCCEGAGCGLCGMGKCQGCFQMAKYILHAGYMVCGSPECKSAAERWRNQKDEEYQQRAARMAAEAPVELPEATKTDILDIT